MSKPDEEKFFVSRRGHQVGINQVDLSDIDVEHEQAATERKPSPEPSPQEASGPIHKPDRPRKHPSLKKRVVLVAIVAVLLVPVMVGEAVGAQYRSGTKSAKQQLASLTTKTVLPLQKKSAITADQIQAVANDVNHIVGSMCRGGLLDNMATLYPRAKTDFDNCKSAQRSYAALTSGLYALEEQTRYLEKVGSIMKPVATPITDEYAVVGAQLSTWKATTEQLKKLSPPTKMSSIHAKLYTHASTVTEQWSKLNIANNSQDAAGFLEAEKALATGYEAVRTTSAEITSIIEASQADVTRAYNALP